MAHAGCRVQLLWPHGGIRRVSVHSDGGRRRIGECRSDLRSQMQHAEDWLETALCQDTHAELDFVHSHTRPVLDGHFGLTGKASVLLCFTTSLGVASVGQSLTFHLFSFVHGHRAFALVESVALGLLSTTSLLIAILDSKGKATLAQSCCQVHLVISAAYECVTCCICFTAKRFCAH